MLCNVLQPVLRSALFSYPYPGAYCDLDFLAQQYRWGGQSRTQADFDTFQNITFGSSGAFFNGTDCAMALTAADAGVSGSEFTIILVINRNANTNSFERIIELNDGTSTNRLVIYHDGGQGSIWSLVDSGGANQSNAAIGIASVGARAVVACRIKLNDAGFYMADGSETLDTSLTLPTITRFDIGHIRNVQEYTGFIERIVVFNSSRDDYIGIASSL